MFFHGQCFFKDFKCLCAFSSGEGSSVEELWYPSSIFNSSNYVREMEESNERITTQGKSTSTSAHRPTPLVRWPFASSVGRVQHPVLGQNARCLRMPVRNRLNLKSNVYRSEICLLCPCTMQSASNYVLECELSNIVPHNSYSNSSYIRYICGILRKRAAPHHFIRNQPILAFRKRKRMLCAAAGRCRSWWFLATQLNCPVPSGEK